MIASPIAERLGLSATAINFVGTLNLAPESIRILMLTPFRCCWQLGNVSTWTNKVNPFPHADEFNVVAVTWLTNGVRNCIPFMYSLADFYRPLLVATLCMFAGFYGLNRAYVNEDRDASSFLLAFFMCLTGIGSCAGIDHFLLTNPSNT